MRIGQNMKNRSLCAVFFCTIVIAKKSLKNRSLHIAACFVYLICLQTHAISSLENIGQLRTAIAEFLTKEYQSTSATDIKIKVGGLDSRLNLTRCPNSHSLTLQDPNGNGGNVNVQVACSGLSGWTILVPAQVIVYRPVAIARRDLSRGTLIASDDLTLEILDMSQYRQGFSREPKDIVGKELKYPVTKGSTFRTSVLDSPLVIKRGDDVSVEALAGSIQVVAKGTAVSDGRLGQMIRVRNTQSERILSAKVIGHGKVQSVL
jgi:flagellar basal body P-ring formation protein FlgA